MVMLILSVPAERAPLFCVCFYPIPQVYTELISQVGLYSDRMVLELRGSP